MVERELKLHVPPAAKLGLEQELTHLGAQAIVLRARYFDTPRRELAAAGVALRLRLEGDTWVQTIKAPGPDELSRLETNHERAEPTLDLSLYQGSPVEALLAGLQGPLLLRYETHINRLVYRHDTGQGVVEFAYDQGVITAQGLELGVCELELEQISSDIDALFTLGEEWLRRYGLIVDLRSKAERGDALAKLADKTAARGAKGDHAVADLDRLYRPHRSRAVALHKAQHIHDVYQQCAADCLNQAIRNAAFLAGVDGPRHNSRLPALYVRELRVGIRRLRTCWKFFEPWIGSPKHAGAAELRNSFSSFGIYRDSDVVHLEITPSLLKAGMVHVHWPASELPPRPTPQLLAASTGFQILLLLLLREQVMARDVPVDEPSTNESPAGARQKLQDMLTLRLDSWLKKIVREGKHFERLTIDAQHELRKRVKSLRYALEFCIALLPGKRPEHLRASLEVVQEALGQLNDLYVAHAAYKKVVQHQPQAWFAVGWLAAMQEVKKAQAALCFSVLAEAAAHEDTDKGD